MIAYSLPPSIEPMIAPTLASCNHWRVCTDTLHLGLIVSCRVSKLSQISFSACHVFCLSHRKACKQKENQFMRKGSDIKVAHVVHCSTKHPDAIGRPVFGGICVLQLYLVKLNQSRHVWLLQCWHLGRCSGKMRMLGLAILQTSIRILLSLFFPI